MFDQTEWERKRYAEDPKFRARKAAYQKCNKEKINAHRRLRYATDPDYRDRARAAARAGTIKMKYGITIQQYNALFAKQKGRCAICKEKSKGWLHVDHCHRTRLTRGLLCGLCNRGLGCFRDGPRLLRGAAAYVGRFLKAKPRRHASPPPPSGIESRRVGRKEHLGPVFRAKGAVKVRGTAPH
jgi:hypothetical protein